MIGAQPLPFKEVDGKTELTGPVFLSCGCGNVTARWASVQQNLATKIPQAKPKSSRMINDWLNASGLKEELPVLKQHQYGVVVVPLEKLEAVDIMPGTTMGTAQRIAELIRRYNEQSDHHQTA